MADQLHKIRKLELQELDIKIELLRQVLYKKIEDDNDRIEIQKISEMLDKLIVEYLRK